MIRTSAAVSALAAFVVASALLAQLPPPPPPLVGPNRPNVITPTPGPANNPARAQNVKPEFDLKTERKVTEVARTLANEDQGNTSETAYYTVTLKLIGPEDLKAPVSVEYRVFYAPPMGENALLPPSTFQRQNGTASAPSLKVGDSITFDTPSFSIPRSVMRNGYAFYADGTRTRFKADLAGIWLRVSIGGKVVYDRAEPDSVKGKAEF